MPRAVWALAMAGGVAFAAAGHAAEVTSLDSVSVTLPRDDRAFPDGPGARAVNDTCRTCHSVGMVLYQPTLTDAQWRAEVTKMRTVYKASVAPGDVDAIVGYLRTLPPPN